MRKYTIMLIVGSLTGLVLASPALAQSLDRDFGSGNTLPMAYTSQNRALQQIGSDNGRHAFDQAPEPQAQLSPSDAGASSGYDNLLSTH